MTFDKQFENWLERGFETEIPKNIKAFSFNLYEPALVEGVKFGIELIGAGEFSLNDPDWACNEVWEPQDRQLFIPIEYSGENWEPCFEKMKHLISEILNKDKEYIKKLKASKGIAIGFVDGDLEVIWQP